MTNEKFEKFKAQIMQLPDFEVVRVWNIVQVELERRDASWPQVRGYRAVRSLPDEKIKRLEGAGGSIALIGKEI